MHRINSNASLSVGDVFVYFIFKKWLIYIWFGVQPNNHFALTQKTKILASTLSLSLSLLPYAKASKAGFYFQKLIYKIYFLWIKGKRKSPVAALNTHVIISPASSHLFEW